MNPHDREARRLNLITATVAGFRTAHGCSPQRFEYIFDEIGELIGVECSRGGLTAATMVMVEVEADVEPVFVEDTPTMAEEIA